MTTVRDFTHVFDAYAQFEELSLKTMMDGAEENELSEDENVTLDLYMARFEDVIGKFLKNVSVLALLKLRISL